MADGFRAGRLLLGAWVIVLAAAGAWMGVRLAGRGAPAPVPTVARSVPAFLLASQSRLPFVQLLGDGPVPVSAADVLGREGTVVLFLDMECDPCRFAASQWQLHRDADRMNGVEVVGITSAPRERIQDFHETLGLDFPIYADANGAYFQRHGVDSFPWQVIVDRDGDVMSYTGNLSEIGRIDALSALP